MFLLKIEYDINQKQNKKLGSSHTAEIMKPRDACLTWDVFSIFKGICVFLVPSSPFLSICSTNLCSWHQLFLQKECSEGFFLLPNLLFSCYVLVSLRYSMLQGSVGIWAKQNKSLFQFVNYIVEWRKALTSHTESLYLSN